MGDCLWTRELFRYTNQNHPSHFSPHPRLSGLGQSGTDGRRLVWRGAFTCIGRQELCDPIWQATLRNSEMDYHYEL